jgi:hypothetical protein
MSETKETGQAETPLTRHDPANYAKLRTPMQSLDEMNALVAKFAVKVREARQACFLPDVLVAVAADYVGEDGEVRMGCTHVHFGDTGRSEELAAIVVGRERTRHQQYINALLNRSTESAA